MRLRHHDRSVSSSSSSVLIFTIFPPDSTEIFGGLRFDRCLRLDEPKVLRLDGHEKLAPVLLICFKINK